MRYWQAQRAVWWVAAAYAGLTVVMTWPMAIRLSSPYTTIHEDFGEWLWNLWWMKKALVELGTSPYFTSYIFHPTGTSLVFHNLSLYHGLIGIPLQLLGADLLTTYNLLYLSSFVIGGVGMFLLVRELTGNAFASFFAGAVYTFSPSHTVAYQWMDMWGTEWLPFALLFAIRLLRGRGPLDGIGLAIALILATLTDWHQPIILLLAIMVLALSVAFSRHQPGPVPPGGFRRLLWSFLLYGLLVSPLGYLVWKELVTGDAILYTRSHWTFELLGFRGVRGVIPYSALLGWVPIAFVIYGVAGRLDFWMKRFVALLIVFFILSLGERLRLLGVDEPLLPLPYLLWRKIPVMGIIRNPVHFWIMVQVCVAVLAGHGVKKLWERLEGRPRKFALPRPVLVTSLLGLMLVEVLQAPLTQVSLRTHPVYAAISREDGSAAILDAPVGYAAWATTHHAGRSMYFQTLHGRPLVGGSTNFDSTKRLAFLKQNPVLMLFTDGWIPQVEVLLDKVETLRSFLAKHQVSWVILRKNMRDPVCDQRMIPGLSLKKLVNLVPAVINAKLRAVWNGEIYCGDWDVSKVQKVDALVRRTLGPPLWDDAELVAYRVR